MLISTKGRYALRVMADLARNGGEEYVVLMDIAERQNISEKYLEGIVAALSRCGFLQTQRGRGGGYRLARCPGGLRRRRYPPCCGGLHSAGILRQVRRIGVPERRQLSHAAALEGA